MDFGEAERPMVTTPRTGEDARPYKGFCSRRNFFGFTEGEMASVQDAKKNVTRTSPQAAVLWFTTPRTGEDARPYKEFALTVTFSVSPKVKWHPFRMPRKTLHGLRRRRPSCGSRLHV